jgi:hypothetical protein
MIFVYIRCTYTYSLSPKAYSMNDENARDRKIDQKQNSEVYSPVRVMISKTS